MRRFGQRFLVVAAVLCSCAGNPQAQVAPPAATTPDGGRYYGALVNGQLQGRGRLEWRNGSVYEGDFDSGLMSGRGRLRFASGDLYEGEFRDGMMHGNGRFDLKDGSHYVGEFRDDDYHGRGRYESPGREVYEGEFRQGYYWGRGQATYDDGRKFSGEFVRGDYQGKGRLETAHGEVYEGEFKGFDIVAGTLTRKDGSRYEGSFAKGLFEGAGRYSDGKGNVYEGPFVNGTLEGSGKYSNAAAGTSYEGEFKDWRFHGEGVLRMPNGDVYRGGFAHGTYEGNGTLTFATPQPDGRRELKGAWRYGMFEPEADRARLQGNVEAALYAQRQLLDQAIAALAPRVPGRPNLYLLAVAGDGSQEVFRREVEFVRDSFAARFGSKGHTITLVNSRSTVGTLPMATHTSLREAVAAIAARMDRREDMLFLFLTSHGSRDYQLTLGQAGMDLRDLSAASLGELLAGSGIMWKVVVVSACYAGGFADALKGEGTLVIAAARHDRQSFGCADGNDFTHFGQAFFRDALPQAGSFQEAFRRAETLVGEREMAELNAAPGDERRSLPQMFSSPEIERYLARWWAKHAAPR